MHFGVRSPDTNFGHIDSTPSEILLQISDMDTLPPGLKSQILDRVDRGEPDGVWTPSDFLDLAGRDAVDKTLQRLVKWGSLRRIDRGLYDKPRFNRLTQQNSPADPKAVIDAVARRDAQALVDYRARAPQAERAHPTEEHYLPLLVALGASAPHEAAALIPGGMTYGVLSMDSFGFGLGSAWPQPGVRTRA